MKLTTVFGHDHGGQCHPCYASLERDKEVEKGTYKIKVVHNAVTGIYGEFAIAIPGNTKR